MMEMGLPPANEGEGCLPHPLRVVLARHARKLIRSPHIASETIMNQRETSPHGANGTATSGGELLCQCCTPPNLLIQRPDLGTFADGGAKYAICVLHQPDPIIYANDGRGFTSRPDLALDASGAIVDRQGRVVAHGEMEQPGAGPIDMRDDGGYGGSHAVGRTHVDLSQDDFYGR